MEESKICFWDSFLSHSVLVLVSVFLSFFLSPPTHCPLLNREMCVYFAVKKRKEKKRKRKENKKPKEEKWKTNNKNAICQVSTEWLFTKIGSFRDCLYPFLNNKEKGEIKQRHSRNRMVSVRWHRSRSSTPIFPLRDSIRKPIGLVPVSSIQSVRWLDLGTFRVSRGTSYEATFWMSTETSYGSNHSLIWDIQ